MKGRSLRIRIYFILLTLLILVFTLLGFSGVLLLINRAVGLSVSISSFLWGVLIAMALEGVAITYFTASKILTPISEIEEAMKKVAEGNFSVRLSGNSRIGELKRIYESFNLMVKELQATEILQTDFVSNVSHEFKTPINAIEGYAMLLQDGALTPGEEEEYIEKILFNTKRLTELIGGILLLSKVENQVISLRDDVFSPDEQIRLAIVSLEEKWTKKEIEFETDLAEIRYRGNEALLAHVWLNLLDNAVKFSPRGGKIYLSLSQEGGQTVFSVRDEGPGIDREKQKHIFDKFYQVETSHGKEGNGLGLTLVKRIVDLHRGSVTVENAEGGGCRFTVELPEREMPVRYNFLRFEGIEHRK